MLVDIGGPLLGFWTSMMLGNQSLVVSLVPDRGWCKLNLKNLSGCEL